MRCNRIVGRQARRLLDGPHGARKPTRSLSTSGLPQIIQTRGVPIHLYADEIEPQAMEQVKLLAESPIPVDYVSVMPDAHLGKGVTIGTVFASEKYVCPNAVGVDIGCEWRPCPSEDCTEKGCRMRRRWRYSIG